MSESPRDLCAFCLSAVNRAGRRRRVVGDMPGTVVAGLAGCIRADNGHIPWLDVSFDGLGETNQHTRLEAFLHQAGQFRHRRSNGWGRLNR